MTHQTIYTSDDAAIMRRLIAKRGVADRLAVWSLVASAAFLVAAVAMLCAGYIWESSIPIGCSLGASYAASAVRKRADTLNAEHLAWLKAASEPQQLGLLRNARKRNPRMDKN